MVKNEITLICKALLHADQLVARRPIRVRDGFDPDGTLRTLQHNRFQERLEQRRPALQTYLVESIHPEKRESGADWWTRFLTRDLLTLLGNTIKYKINLHVETMRVIPLVVMLRHAEFSLRTYFRHFQDLHAYYNICVIPLIEPSILPYGDERLEDICKMYLHDLKHTEEMDQRHQFIFRWLDLNPWCSVEQLDAMEPLWPKPFRSMIEWCTFLILHEFRPGELWESTFRHALHYSVSDDNTLIGPVEYMFFCTLLAQWFPKEVVERHFQRPDVTDYAPFTFQTLDPQNFYVVKEWNGGLVSDFDSLAQFLEQVLEHTYRNTYHRKTFSFTLFGYTYEWAFPSPPKSMKRSRERSTSPSSKKRKSPSSPITYNNLPSPTHSELSPSLSG